MNNPHAIKIHCDGAMDYDKNKTGGNGFVIQYPDVFEKEPFEKSLRRDSQGIHQLEIIGIIEAMDELIRIYKNELLPKCSSGVIIYTDRYSVPILLNPYTIKGYISNGWKNDESKPIKDKELINRADKTRNKLSQIVGGRVELKYISRKKNRRADTLSGIGKKTSVRSKMVVKIKNTNITKRLFDGLEISYDDLKSGDEIYVRIYAWEMVGNMYEIKAEIYEGYFLGRKIKMYVDSSFKGRLHRTHKYKIHILKSNRHHILVESVEDVE